MILYITFDLRNAGQRGARELLLPGPLLGWDVGEFPNASGVKHHGVRVRYHDPRTGYEQIQLVEIPPNAGNIRVRDRIPREYKAALDSAA